MATLEEIGSALKKAAAAGDTAAATTLAKAYKAAQGQQAAPDAPAGPPGSKAYADWAVAQAKAGKTLPQVSAPPPQPSSGLTPALAAIPATMQGITGSIPGLNQAADALVAGGESVGDLVTGKPVDFGARYNAIQDRRTQISDAAPISSLLGGLGGTVGLTGGVGSVPAGAEALGLTGKFGKQVLNSVLSTGAYEGAQGLAHGHTGGELLKDEAMGGLGGLTGPIVGSVLKGTGETIAKAVTKGAQDKVTTAAINGAQTSKQMFNAGSDLFNKAFGGDVPAVSDTAMMKLVGNIRDAVSRYRPNEHTTPQAVGLLQHVMELADAANTPGVVVDLKDLHILRQAANDVRQSPGANDTTKTIAGKVIGSLDGFIGKLSPGDILGGSDPKEAANAMLRAISTWSKASKVSMIEKAIQHAETYKSGTENGLKLSFLALMKTPEYQHMSQVEKDAIQLVAKGTTTQNVAEGLGKLGFSLGKDSAHNILGGTAGTGILTAGLTPVLGPLALPVAFGTTTAVGAAGRRIATGIAKSGAERVAQIVATPGIRQVPKAPNLLAPPSVPIDLLTRAAVGGSGG